MAGIYIHIPFCKQACTYCNFYFSTSLYFKEDYLAALIKEIELRKDYLENQQVDTIYFGGGTPSILSDREIATILDELYRKFNISRSAEITLEANPDDLTAEKIIDLKTTRINRLSVGIQSFFADDLKYMNRAHSAKEAVECIINAQTAGFTNISIDLIYGTPSLTNERWMENLKQAENLKVKHLSCYALTVEENTALFQLIKKKKSIAPKNEVAAEHFEILQEYALKNSWKHYEISNLCKMGFESKHNTSYWQNKSYLGLGVAAHSYNGKSRSWNLPNMKKYIETLKSDKLYAEQEILSEEEKYNEYIMTGLRTEQGISKKIIADKFSDFSITFLSNMKQISKEWIFEGTDRVSLTKSGKLYADRIASDLFV